jgi:hypothetical protein
MSAAEILSGGIAGEVGTVVETVEVRVDVLVVPEVEVVDVVDVIDVANVEDVVVPLDTVTVEVTVVVQPDQINRKTTMMLTSGTSPANLSLRFFIPIRPYTPKGSQKSRQVMPA